MLSHRDQSDLVPRPRGCLPKLCALGAAAFSTATAVFWFPQRVLGWIAMVTLLLTSGPVLHGLFLLLEEILNHENRYRGRSRLVRVLSGCGLGLKAGLSVGLSGLMLYVCGSPVPLPELWALLSLVPVLYAAFRSLGVLGPSEVELSGVCEDRKMNVAHGLAWSFYLGYLRLVLPRLENSISAFCATHRNSGALKSRGSKRLLILIPVNASVSHKLEDEDDRIHFHDNLPNSELDRAGVRGRVYRHSVYRVLDGCGKSQDCVVEYATPLLTLYSMSQDSTAGFGEAERRQQVLLFYRTLRDVLDRSLECRNRYTLILLDDQHEDDPHYLSKCILGHLRQQGTEEFPMIPPETPPPQQEQTVPAAPAPSAPALVPGHTLSREPTLMFSLDKPRSLKSPMEITDCFQEQPRLWQDGRLEGH